MLGGPISQAKFLPKKCACYFHAAIYDVRMPFFNRLRMEIQISGYVWTGKNDVMQLRVAEEILRKQREKFALSNLSGYVWTGPQFPQAFSGQNVASCYKIPWQLQQNSFFNVALQVTGKMAPCNRALRDNPSITSDLSP